MLRDGFDKLSGTISVQKIFFFRAAAARYPLISILCFRLLLLDTLSYLFFKLRTEL